MCECECEQACEVNVTCVCHCVGCCESLYCGCTTTSDVEMGRSGRTDLLSSDPLLSAIEFCADTFEVGDRKVGGLEVRHELGAQQPFSGARASGLPRPSEVLPPRPMPAQSTAGPRGS